MKVDKEVLLVLTHARCDGDTLTLVGQLDRALYVRTNKVLEAAGGKWNRKAKAHLFDGGAEDAMEQIILTGEVTVPQNFGYFPTPAAIVDRLIDLADLESEMIVLEPSAGQGNIAKRLVEYGCRVHCIELLEKNVQALNDCECFETVLQADFLEVEQEHEDHESYDRVVMNPPFQNQNDLKHINHALKFVKPRYGRLVSVMSASVTFRDNKLTTDFRSMVKEHGGWFEDVPDGAFKESGTMVKTCIVVIPC